MEKKEILHIAKLARIKFNEDELEHIANDMTGILKQIDMLQAADTTSVDILDDDKTPLREREDIVNISGLSNELIENAPEPYEHFFTVPKVVE